VVLAVYLITLTPQVGLGYSGTLCVGAMYAGVPKPRGYPIWTLYSWLFTILLPLSNIEWRVAVSSAVAGALSCGLLALVVSRGGAVIFDSVSALPPSHDKWAKICRIVPACSAGMGFGFDGAFWGSAVVPDTWPLTMLLLMAVIYLLFEWSCAPRRRSYLLAAAFVYGLAITNSQALLSAALGLQVIVMLQNMPLAGAISLFNGALFCVITLFHRFTNAPLLDLFHRRDHPLYWLWPVVGLASMFLGLRLTLKTGQVASELKTVAVSAVLFLCGVSFYLLSPVLSMTNPPINWSYARTVTGFEHLVTRGQFESLHPASTFSEVKAQASLFIKVATKQLGFFYVMFALVPWIFFRRLERWERRWLIGLTAVFLCLSVLLLLALNPQDSRQSLELDKGFHSASHLILVILSGYGMVLASAVVVRRSEL
jgi:hypothetical protein